MRWTLMVLIAITTLAFGQYVSWHPPHAVLIQAYPINATHFMAYEERGAVYIVQDGLSFSGSDAERQAVMQYLYAQCRYVAVDVLNVSLTEGGELWLSDVYCSSDGRRWLWLRWLPLRFTAYRSYVDFVNATDAAVTTPVGNFSLYVPAGWYMDLATKTVFRLPSFNVSLLAQIHNLDALVQQLRAQVQRGEADVNKSATLIAQLKAQIEALEAQRRALEEVAKQRESLIAALSTNLQVAKAENDVLKRRFEDLRRENEALKNKIQELNKTWTAEVARLEAELQSTQLQAEEGGSGLDPLPILLALLGGVVAAFVIYRKKKAEE